jgi:hypothetical protein
MRLWQILRDEHGFTDLHDPAFEGIFDHFPLGRPGVRCKPVAERKLTGPARSYKHKRDGKGADEADELAAEEDPNYKAWQLDTIRKARAEWRERLLTAA